MFFCVNDFVYSRREDESSLAKRVSLLNFEPRSQSFLVTVATRVAAVTHTTIRSLFCFNGSFRRVRNKLDFFHSTV